MYEDFFGLKAKPFQVSPDPAFIYWSKSHSMTIAMLRYGVMSHSPLTVITGEVGAGKTTLLRQMLDEMPEDLVTGLISNMQPGKGGLLEWALMAFDQPYANMTYVERFDTLQKFIIEAYAEGGQVALIVDEAQNLSMDQLEELRMLTNINAEADLLLQIFLVGQPELREMLTKPELRQFSQRITSDFHLESLQEAEVAEYIARRLEVAGAEWEVFPAAACKKIYNITRGVPRLINVLADLCLVYAFSSERKVVDDEILGDLMQGIQRNGIFNQFAPMQPAEAKEPAPAEQPRDEAISFAGSVKPFPNRAG
ncbi:MAG: AAA family ATPase [Pseudomonadota bacterium]